jgi:hypothetical protein
MAWTVFTARVATLVAFFALAGASQSQEGRPKQPRQDSPDKSMIAPSDAKPSASSGAMAAAFLEAAFQGERPPEAARMLAAILRGSPLGPGEGWFGPAETRYTWTWLAKHCNVDPAARTGISRAQFPGSDVLFSRLDRDKDGIISPEDLDWSDRSSYLQISNMSNRLFRSLNAKSNGRLTRDELLQFFDAAAHSKDHVSADDFRDALLAGLPSGGKPTDMPAPAVLIRGLFAGEIGSMNEGPKLNWLAPDFSLKTVDGSKTIQLSKLVGPKAVVLIFGSFT